MVFTYYETSMLSKIPIKVKVERNCDYNNSTDKIMSTSYESEMLNVDSRKINMEKTKVVLKQFLEKTLKDDIKKSMQYLNSNDFSFAGAQPQLSHFPTAIDHPSGSQRSSSLKQKSTVTSKTEEKSSRVSKQPSRSASFRKCLDIKRWKNSSSMHQISETSKSQTLPLPGVKLLVSASENSPARPKHLNLKGKKKSSKKFQQFLRFFHKRSSAHSSPEVKETKSEGGKTIKKSSSSKKQTGPHSFSPGDMTEQERSDVVLEFVETLNRLSTRYAHHIHSSRSTTPGSQLQTPGSWLQTPGLEDCHDPLKHSNQFPFEKQLSTHNERCVRNSRPLSRRHTHHTSHRERHRFVPNNDVVDGPILKNDIACDGETQSSSSSNYTSNLRSQNIQSSSSCTAQLTTEQGRLSSDEVDKLVQNIAMCLRNQGDRYQDVVNTPDVIFQPALRHYTLRYVRDLTYSGFQDLAQRFCAIYQQNSVGVPSSHTDVFPFVIVLDMTRFIYNVASFEAASGVAGRIVDYSSAFITEMAERTGWDDLRQRLQQTEEELSQTESLTISPMDGCYSDLD